MGEYVGVRSLGHVEAPRLLEEIVEGGYVIGVNNLERETVGGEGRDPRYLTVSTWFGYISGRARSRGCSSAAAVLVWTAVSRGDRSRIWHRSGGRGLPGLERLIKGKRMEDNLSHVDMQGGRMSSEDYRETGWWLGKQGRGRDPQRIQNRILKGVLHMGKTLPTSFSFFDWIARHGI